jgi:hypothetical protein
VTQPCAPPPLFLSPHTACAFSLLHASPVPTAAAFYVCTHTLPSNNTPPPPYPTLPPPTPQA